MRNQAFFNGFSREIKIASALSSFRNPICRSCRNPRQSASAITLTKSRSRSLGQEHRSITRVTIGESFNRIREKCPKKRHFRTPSPNSDLPVGAHIFKLVSPENSLEFEHICGAKLISTSNSGTLWLTAHSRVSRENGQNERPVRVSGEWCC